MLRSLFQQVDNRFEDDRYTIQPGQSGNPAGRRPGARNKSTIAAEALLDGEAEALTRKAVDMALAGDSVALRLCLERILPPRRTRNVSLAIEPPSDAQGVSATFSGLLGAVLQGEVSPDEAAGVAQLLEAQRKAIETVELEQRIAALEARK